MKGPSEDKRQKGDNVRNTGRGKSRNVKTEEQRRAGSLLQKHKERERGVYAKLLGCSCSITEMSKGKPLPGLLGSTAAASQREET